MKIHIVSLNKTKVVSFKDVKTVSIRSQQELTTGVSVFFSVSYLWIWSLLECIQLYNN